MALTVLITNLVLSGRSGTEVVSEQLADGLRRAGHRPMLYTTRRGPLAKAMAFRGFVVIDRLEALPVRPDIIHGHHNAPLMAALTALPEVNALFVCHDATAMHDEPPAHPRIRRYFAVSEYTRARLLSAGIPAHQTGLLPNSVDETRYFEPRPPLPERPQRALAILNSREHLPALREACARADLTLDPVGAGVGSITDSMWTVMPSYDLVFASGRSALEAAFTGCAVVVCDARGMHGMLRSDQEHLWRQWNLGSAILRHQVTESALLSAIREYDSEDAAAVTRKVRLDASLGKQVEELEAIYREIINMPASPGTDAERQALARFIEDCVPSDAADRPWKELAREAIGAEIDTTLDAMTALRSEILERLDAHRWDRNCSDQRVASEMNSLRALLAELDANFARRVKEAHQEALLEKAGFLRRVERRLRHTLAGRNGRPTAER
jgi:Glycosyltransferase Family 4